MRRIALTVNGRPVEATVEPRTQLADFLREQELLTGTHLGCEHGVCGACTLLIDGAPARSCITYAVAADGASITTIEGLDDDPVTERLRAAFKRHHGLQCGFCTPGMLMTCRDMVLRLPDAEERRIREELSGNLCRCTGYMGIVAAVQSVIAEGGEGGLRVAPPARRLGPVGAGHATAPQEARAGDAAEAHARPAEVSSPQEAVAVTAEQWRAVEEQGVEIRRSFAVGHARDRVWRFFADPEALADCMPGARVTARPAEDRVEGEVAIKLGPIQAAFAGVAELERDEAGYRGRLRGAGRDRRSASRVRGLVSYELQSTSPGETRVEVRVAYLLAGPLAQFSRAGLIQDVANQLTAAFAGNLETRLSGAELAAEARTLDAGRLARQALWSRLQNLVRRLFGRERR